MNVRTARCRPVLVLAVLGIGSMATRTAHSQGCCAARGLSTLPVREGSTTLQPWQLFATYRWNYFEADHIYLGKDRQLPDERAAEVRNVQNEHTLAVEMGVIERLSLIVETPFQVNNRRVQGEAPSGGRVAGEIEQNSAGLADMRFLLRYWLIPDEWLPENLPFYGNIALEAGFKAPTGDPSSEQDHNGESFHHDVSIQTGTGSWDAIFGLAGFLRWGPFVPHANIRYLLTPQEKNGTPAFHPELADPDTPVENSIPDQVNWRVGMLFDAGRVLRRQIVEEEVPLLDRFRLAFDFTGTHVLIHDLIGGSEGFRRSFDAVFFEPGFEWGISERCFINLGVPITIYRYLSTNAGTFPEVQVNLGVSFAIN